MRAQNEAPTLVFDGECHLCRRAVGLLRRWDREHRLRYVPFQDEAAIEELDLSLPALAAAMHLVLPDGRVCAGADAVPELGRLLPGKRWWAWGFAVPGVRWLARRVYARIARRRRCAVRGLPAATAP
jgi:predicted DCC family thiol-disulfide oxidoreductase YuxK